ncbi:MAG: DNA-3-methyladenine glycosylase [Chitinophagaceae bacterium]|nr:DNA-3-methyladenine glycosylase [Chitinophagaceae bacterium]
MTNKKLPLSFYLRSNVLRIARELPGKFLVTEIGGVKTSGMITEVEAYEGITDRASHAYNHRRTNRTEVMFAQGGTAYVYLCYGIHHLFNVVTNQLNIPHAILIRAIEPVEGIATMMERRKKLKLDFTLTAGPGAVSQALGISTAYTGSSLLSRSIWLEDRGIKIAPRKIIAGPRIGVEYAGEDSMRPYRFYITGNSWVSKQPNSKHKVLTSR